MRLFALQRAKIDIELNNYSTNNLKIVISVTSIFPLYENKKIIKVDVCAHKLCSKHEAFLCARSNYCFI